MQVGDWAIPPTRSICELPGVRCIEVVESGPPEF